MGLFDLIEAQRKPEPPKTNWAKGSVEWSEEQERKKLNPTGAPPPQDL